MSRQAGQQCWLLGIDIAVYWVSSNELQEIDGLRLAWRNPVGAMSFQVVLLWCTSSESKAKYLK